MEEFIQLVNVVKHDSFIPHHIFDLAADWRMFTVLTNLPIGTRIAAPDYPNLPEYFVAPMEALRFQTFSESRNYLFKILIDK